MRYQFMLGSGKFFGNNEFVLDYDNDSWYEVYSNGNVKSLPNFCSLKSALLEVQDSYWKAIDKKNYLFNYMVDGHIKYYISFDALVSVITSDSFSFVRSVKL